MKTVVVISKEINRALLFRVPGRTIRLGPGESTEIPLSYLEAPELKRLLVQRSVSVLKEKGTEKKGSDSVASKEKKEKTAGGEGIDKAPQAEDKGTEPAAESIDETS